MTDLVIVTGTSGGIGRATARRLVGDGYQVVGVARREVDPADVGPGYVHVTADLSRLDELPVLARALVREHGVPYGLVNNAAIGLDGLLPTMHNSELRSVVELDLIAPMLLTKYLCRPMVAHGRGRIVNVSSVVARTGYRGLAVYAAAKAGLEGFTRSLARDLGPRGVTVNAVAPGFLDTGMTASMTPDQLDRIRRRSPLGRFVTPDEVAAAIAHVLSPDAASMTGTVVTVDAGASA